MPNEPQNDGSQGDWMSGKTGQQSRDNAPLQTRAIDEDDTAVKGVSVQETGAKRRSFFKDRDYGA